MPADLLNIGEGISDGIWALVEEMADISRHMVGPQDSLQTTMECMDRTGAGIALVVDNTGKLLDIITDGDLRRAILRHVSLNVPVSEILERRELSQFPRPLVMPAGTPKIALLNIMRQHGIRQIPIVDGDGRVVRLELLLDLVNQTQPEVVALLMAGGFGRRLYPLTETTPKPLLPIGKEPILQRTIKSLRDAGITDIKIAVHYKKELVREYFRDGSALGIDIEYIDEDAPLGTAGSLSRISSDGRPILLMNGDIVTDVNFQAMIDFHRHHGADLTVAVAPHEVTIPFGVIETEDIRIRGIVEKPTRREIVSIGVYVLQPSVCKLIPSNVAYDMPELIQRLLGDKRYVIGFPVREYWRDLGRPEDLAQAEKEILRWKRRGE